MNQAVSAILCRMRPWIAFLLLTATVVVSIHGQQPEAKDFPLKVEIESADVVDPGLSTEEKAQNSQMGLAPPSLVIFHAAVNGERHWFFECRPEVEGRESVPCTVLPKGSYQGRWVHDHFVIQIVGGDSDAPVTRFLMVMNDMKNLAPPDDPVLQIPAYNFNVTLPTQKFLNDYDLLIHVYGSVSMEIPVGIRPGHTSCDQSTWNPIQTSVNCTTLPPREVKRGYVDVDFSSGQRGKLSMHCEAKWRWSRCSSLEPGLYYARADDKKREIFVLTHEEDGQPKEIGFEFNFPSGQPTQSPIK